MLSWRSGSWRGSLRYNLFPKRHCLLTKRSRQWRAPWKTVLHCSLRLQIPVEGIWKMKCGKEKANFLNIRCKMLDWAKRFYSAVVIAIVPPIAFSFVCIYACSSGFLARETIACRPACYRTGYSDCVLLDKFACIGNLLGTICVYSCCFHFSKIYFKKSVLLI